MTMTVTETAEHADPLPTRRSLLSRLRDTGDDRSWREFFELYGRLIHEVVVKAGVGRNDADEVVQETMACVAATMPDFRYDPARGSFKSWLRTLARRRVADYFRKLYRDPMLAKSQPTDPDDDAADALPDEAAEQRFSETWEAEWRQHLMERALSRLGSAVSARDRQVFDLAVLRGWPSDKVRAATGVGAAFLYVVKHRVGKLVRREIDALRQELE